MISFENLNSNLSLVLDKNKKIKHYIKMKNLLIYYFKIFDRK